MCKLDSFSAPYRETQEVTAALTVRLSDCRADDRKSISCRKRTKCHKDNDPQVEGVDDMLAS
jgi:hypothetical protein